jgi:hypothetical protein
MRWLPWLLLPLILIPLIRSIIRTTRPSGHVADTMVPADIADSLPVYQPDTATATPATHAAPHKTHPATHHPDSAAKKEGLLTKVGNEVDKLGGGNAPVTPEGQGAMGGDGPSGKAPTGTDAPPTKPPAAEGAMGGDGPPGQR